MFETRVLKVGFFDVPTICYGAVASADAKRGGPRRRAITAMSAFSVDVRERTKRVEIAQEA